MLGRFNLNIRLKYSFALIISLLLLLGIFSISEMWRLSELTEKLFNHPYTVSTAALRIEGNITKMHRSMKDVALAHDNTGIQAARKTVDVIEQMVLEDFDIINDRFLGDKQQVKKARALFIAWKPIRDEVIDLMMTGKRREAALITQQKGAQHVHRLYETIGAFIDFASNKANGFYSAAQNQRDKSLIITCAVVMLAIVIGWFFAHSITNALNQAISSISSSSNEIAATVTQQERVANQQNSSVSETNTTMEELGASSRQTAEQSENAAENARHALNLVDDGVDRVNEMRDGMHETKERVEAIAKQILSLSEHTSQIGNITNTVTDFANETKMLAMNAAVEAVRAGEHGKGFSVLSVEIRKLADESKRSAEKINGLVSQIQKATNTTVMVTEEGTKTVSSSMALAEKMSDTFNDVADSVNSASDSSQQISMNVRQQAVAIKQVVSAMKLISAGTKEGAAGITQVKGGVQSLNATAKKLKDMV
ncbi:MAG: methyl-accepting chemotaxis protein [Magnetococcales bacterium]|nr:methyl-accepting chemotaxis protein [Magnetococcales bacterium]